MFILSTSNQYELYKNQQNPLCSPYPCTTTLILRSHILTTLPPLHTSLSCPLSNLHRPPSSPSPVHLRLYLSTLSSTFSLAVRTYRPRRTLRSLRSLTSLHSLCLLRSLYSLLSLLHLSIFLLLFSIFPSLFFSSLLPPTSPFLSTASIPLPPSVDSLFPPLPLLSLNLSFLPYLCLVSVYLHLSIFAIFLILSSLPLPSPLRSVSPPSTLPRRFSFNCTMIWPYVT